jgi:hypothetical protein
MLLLFFLKQLRIGLLLLYDLLLSLLQLPKPILHILLLLQQFVLHFVVVPEEEHLVVDECLEGMRLEAHVDKEDQIIQQFAIASRRIKVPPIQFRCKNHLEGVELLVD